MADMYATTRWIRHATESKRRARRVYGWFVVATAVAVVEAVVILMGALP